jgi:hypothetical protein
MCAAADLLETVALERTFDADRLNALANHPAVRPTCGGDGESPIDLTPFVNDRHNHAVAWNNGAFLFGWSAPQTYEVHIMVRPEGRGSAAYQMAPFGIAYMLNLGMERLWARVSKDARALRHYTRAAGFKRCGQHVLDIGFGPVTYDLYQWKKRCLQLS